LYAVIPLLPVIAMAIRTTIVEDDVVEILSHYDLGEYKGFEKFATGAGQTTILVFTTSGKYVLRYYENRTKKHILFEVNLVDDLRKNGYPVPAIIQNSSGGFYDTWKSKPCIVIEYIEGAHLHNPNDVFDEAQASRVAEVVARLHILTQSYNPAYLKDREEFNAVYCLRAYEKQTRTKDKEARETWLKRELGALEFPADLPRGICHADLNYGNFLFRNGEIVVVLDFDMSFHGFVIYDIASLLYWWAKPPKRGFNAARASLIVRQYSRHRPLSEPEKKHIYDALKLIILLGISWSDEGDFEESEKSIQHLTTLGRSGFYNALFGGKNPPLLK
jgi:homoserine kinase type II